jgi:hypothetical protein
MRRKGSRFGAITADVILNRINSVFSNWERVDENSWKKRKRTGCFFM